MKHRWYVTRCNKAGKELFGGLYISADNISTTDQGDISFLAENEGGPPTVICVLHRDTITGVFLEPPAGENYVEYFFPEVGDDGKIIPVGTV